ncbi:MAG: phosphodiester glycosidase family protein [Christensenellales bacterium]|jgi:exopolysaccharide biosynthesis protein
MRRKRKSLVVPYAVKNILLDILLIGLGLVVFAYFHHVRPSSMEAVELVLDVGDLPMDADEPFADEDAEEPSADASTPSADAEEPLQDANPFTDGEHILEDLYYATDSVRIEISTGRSASSWYTVADIRVKNPSLIKTAFAKDREATGHSEGVPSMAQRNNAILACNGDYFGTRKKGLVIRNGKLYRKQMSDDTCVLFADGTMEIYSSKGFDLDGITAKKPLQAWSFGPSLLAEDGSAIEGFKHAVAPKNPRTAIGYYAPGHYCLVAVDGRQTSREDKTSSGMTLTELSALMAQLGCKKAYNLDGGRSSVMVFNGKTVNAPYKGGRGSSDIIYIGKGGD